MKVGMSRGRFAVIGVVVALAAVSLFLAWEAGSRSATHRVALPESLCRTGATASLPARAASSFPFSEFRAATISVRLVLCEAHVVSGRPLKAVLVVVNHTHRTLATHVCPGELVYAGVKRGRFNSVPGALADLCGTIGPPYVPPGASYITIQLPTVSASCDRGATMTYMGTPPCTKHGGWPPALPPGRYRTSVEIYGLPLRSPMLPPRTVSLVRCAAVKDCACSPVGVRPVNGQWVPFC